MAAAAASARRAHLDAVVEGPVPADDAGVPRRAFVDQRVLRAHVGAADAGGAGRAVHRACPDGEACEQAQWLV